MRAAAPGVDRLLSLPSGTLRARLHGEGGGALAVGVPGLSANCFTFAALGAAVALGPGADIITAADRDAFLRAAPHARALEVPANHYGVINHPHTATAVQELLS